MTSASRDTPHNDPSQFEDKLKRRGKGKDGVEDSRQKEEKLQIYPDYCHESSLTIGKYVPLAAKDFEFLKDVGVFSDGRIMYHILNHPIKWVKITGIVVGVEDRDITKKDNQKREIKTGSKRLFTLDDSSGACIECVAISPFDPNVIEVGKVPGHLAQATAAKVKAEEEEKRKRVPAIKPAKKAEEKKIPSVQSPIVPWDDIDLGSIVKVKGRVSMHWFGFLQVEVIKIEVLRGLDAEVKAWNEVREFRESVLSKPWIVSKEEEERCRKSRERELRKAQKRKKYELEKGKGKDRRELMGGHSKKREEENGKNRDGERTKRKDLERVMRVDGAVKRRREHGDEERLGSKNKINYPSLAVRKAAAGKYDLLGI